MELKEQVPFFWQRNAWDQLLRARRHGRLPHALLFSGPQGVGKSLVATALARALLCRQPDESGRACGSCRSCRLLAAGSHPDFHQLTPEEGSSQIRIDAIRRLLDESTLSVGEEGHRVFILDPAERLGMAAANALLKTLEEPLAGIHLLLVTAHPERLPVTIRSRCQQVRIAPPAQEEAEAWLAEMAGLPAERAREALRLGGGAPLAALEMTEADRDLQYRRMQQEFLALSRGKGDPLAIAATWLKELELPALLEYLASWLLMLLRGTLTERVDGGPAVPQEAGQQLDLRSVYELLDNLFESQRNLNHNLNPQLVLEDLLLQWVRIPKGG